MRHFLAAMTQNWLSLFGAAAATATAIVFLTLFGIELLGFQGSPYLGILTFLVLPAILVMGLLLIPAGILRDRRRRRKAGMGEHVPLFPVVDLNRDRTRRLALAFVALTCVNVVIFSVASYKGVEVMDSTAFCGATCHSVMQPEYTTYKRSPHARVPCVSCHIGPGAGWFVKSKMSGSWQLIAVALDLYPRPIATPVKNLRPARETCEQCHWPSKFIGERLKVITHFAEDESSTEKKTVLLLRVGGMQGALSQGIHWHVDPRVTIRYKADAARESISAVELTRPNGTVEVFSAALAPQGAASRQRAGQTKAAALAADVQPPEPGRGPQHPAREQGPANEGWRTMDCVDCHNRPTHIYRLPEDELDLAMEQGRIERRLPYVKREALKALRGTYASQTDAAEQIPRAMRSFYEASYPSLARTQAFALEAAGREIAKIYCSNVFPSMNISWGTYPSHIGHQNTPGCFRCHDEEHKSASGNAISQDCSMCHAVLAMEEENPDILKQLQP